MRLSYPAGLTWRKGRRRRSEGRCYPLPDAGKVNSYEEKPGKARDPSDGTCEILCAEKPSSTYDRPVAVAAASRLSGAKIVTTSAGVISAAFNPVSASSFLNPARPGYSPGRYLKFEKI